MKLFLASIGLLAISVQASNVLIFDTNQTATIRGRSVAYLLSVDTPQYSGRSDVLINPVLPNHPLEWTKTNGAGLVVAMTTTESNAVQAAFINIQSNAVAQMQINAKARSTNFLSDYFNTAEGRFQFAFMEATMDALNTIRGGLAGNTNMPLLTLAQLTNAVKIRLNGQANTSP